MKKFIQKLIRRRHRVVFEEAYMAELLNLFEADGDCVVKQNQVIANCGGDEKDKWFMFMTMTDLNWSKVLEDLDCKGFDAVKEQDGFVYITKRRLSFKERFKKVVGL